MTPSLPSNEENPEQRAAQLAQAREWYQYDYAYYDIGFSDPVFLKGEAKKLQDRIERAGAAEAAEEAEKGGLLARLVAAGELVKAKAEGKLEGLLAEKMTIGYSTSDMAEFTKASIRVNVDRARWAAAMSGTDPAAAGEAAQAKAEAEAEDCKSKKVGRSELGSRFLSLLMEDSDDENPEHPLTMEHYLKMYQSFEMPALAKLWDEDWAFAYQTVGGPIPLLIRSIDALPENFPVTQEIYAGAMGEGSDLAQDLASKKVFLIDFSLFEDYTGGVSFGLQKYCYAPMALFAWQDTEEHKGFGLKPVAIQCGQSPGQEFPIFTPADGWHWKMARFCVQAATGTYRGAYKHFGALHVLLYRIVTATRRTLAENHPLHVLLEHNFEMTLPSAIPTRKILSPGEVEATLLPCEVQATVRQILQGVEDFRFNESVPPALFENRGVLDPKVLPIYPFRDDTTKVWEAIVPFVSGYVGLYYENDAAVTEDVELQAWIHLLKAPEGGRLQGIGQDGQIKTVEALALFIAQIVYRASAFHAAVNYAGFQLFSFPPAMSYAGFAPPPTRETPNCEESFLKMLPPAGFAWGQFYINVEQTTIWANQLGVYPPGYFSDGRVAPLAETFRKRLDEITEEIKVANEGRPFPYVFQSPPDVTSSLHC